MGCCKESGARELVSLRPALGRAAGSALTAFGGSGRWQRGGMTSFGPIGLFAAGISNVPHDPGEHKQRGRPRQQGSDYHRCYRCHDSSLMRPAHAIDNSRPRRFKPRRWIIFARRPMAQDICRAISNRPCCAPADVCGPRGTWSSKIARSTG